MPRDTLKQSLVRPDGDLQNRSIQNRHLGMNEIIVPSGSFGYAGASGNFTCDQLYCSSIVGTIMGSWDATDSGQVGGTGATLARNTVYQAKTDGFVTAYATADNPANTLTGVTDSSNPPTADRVRDECELGSSIDQAGISFPVKKNDFWETGATNTAIIYWISLGG